MKIKEIPVCMERQKSHVKYCKCIITLNVGFLWCDTHKRYKSTSHRKQLAGLADETLNIMSLGDADYHGESD